MLPIASVVNWRAHPAAIKKMDSGQELTVSIRFAAVKPAIISCAMKPDGICGAVNTHSSEATPPMSTFALGADAQLFVQLKFTPKASKPTRTAGGGTSWVRLEYSWRFAVVPAGELSGIGKSESGTITSICVVFAVTPQIAFAPVIAPVPSAEN